MGKKTKPPSIKTVDLHGLTSEEALPLIDQLLLYLQQTGAAQARLITGKGSGKLQKIAIDYLEKGGYRWHHEVLPSGLANTGVLIIDNE